ncbi:MAG: TrmH family RNA methyltransferase [Acidimicrobiia bacterium]
MSRASLTFPIVEPGDPRLDDYRHLNDATLRRRLEIEGGFFVVEGWEPVRRLIGSGWEIRSLLVREDKAHRIADVDAPMYVAAPDLIAAVVGFDLHRGVVASAVRPQAVDWGTVCGSSRLLALLEGINDFENLGAIFRSAAALGVDGMLLAPDVPDPLYRRCVRVSMGAVFLLPFASLEPWPQGILELKRTGFTVLALTPHPSAKSIESISSSARTALMFGSEAHGLSPEALALADERVRIQQSGVLESLNVGHAAAIAFHWVKSGPGR